MFKKHIIRKHLHSSENTEKTIVVSKIMIEKNKIWFIHRILEYGLLRDWVFILKKYGIDEIAQIAINLKDLDKKTISLISVLSGVPKENFLCYNTEASNQKHWNLKKVNE